MEVEVVNGEGSDLSDVSPTIIKVIGCGGGGSNAVNRMIEANIKGVEFIALNTDKQALGRSKAASRLAIGQKLTQGLGAGGDPEIGEKAAQEDKEKISNILKGANMVFVTAGMGGGTGTGSVPIVASIAKEMGALTIGVVTTPFAREGKQRMQLAMEGIKRLRESVDSVIVIPNEKIVKVFGENISYIEQYRLADDILRQGIEGMSRIITDYSYPNIDFADVRAAMQGQGAAIFGIGEASGENRAVEAASKAINNPLLEDFSFDGAKHFVIQVRASSNFSQKELDEISNIVCASACPSYSLKDGIVPDDDMGDAISVTVIATGFNNSAVPGPEPEEVAEPHEETPPVDSNIVSSDEFASLLGGNPVPSAYPDSPNLFESYEEENSDAEKSVPASAVGTFKTVVRPGEQHTAAKSDDLSVPAYLRNRTINLKRK